MKCADRPHWVYRHYDADDVLLYVGITVHPKRRPYERRERPWMADSVRVEIVGPFTQDEATALERKVIREDRPLHNVHQNNGNVTAAQRAADAVTEEEHRAWDPYVLAVLSGAIGGAS